MREPAIPARAILPRFAVIIATSGRPDMVEASLDRLTRQTLPPDQVILSVAAAEDVPASLAARRYGFAVEVVEGPRGLTAQRNRGLDRLAPRIEFVAFFDDDYFARRDGLARLSTLFREEPYIAGASGVLLADGIKGAGLYVAEADRLIAEASRERDRRSGATMRVVCGLYGCNMVFRREAIEGLRFDVRLPLYGWQEDIDFSARARGFLVVTNALVGVHCGVKAGRETRGERLGYSQVANPLYLVGKGTMSRRTALRHMTRNLLANHARMLAPEPWIDRAGRARGNRRALLDLLRGRLAPERILEFA